uniref:DUF5077 domain-containing protein n=1 Tax=Mariniflexile sp. TaxID=1979402 RepID=UPI004048954A
MKKTISHLDLRSIVLVLVLIITVSFSCFSCSQSDAPGKKEVKEENPPALSLTKTVPIGANSWVLNNLVQDQNVISESGIRNWSSLDDVIHTYVKTGAGELNIGLKMKSFDGSSKIKVTVGDISKEIAASSTTYKTEEIGTFTVPAGYQLIEIKGIKKSGNYIADISDILFEGSAIASGITFVPT